MLNESMGRKQFKNAIRYKNYNKKEMEMALDTWTSDGELKKKYVLNDFIDNPQKFIDTILDDPKIRYISEIKYLKNIKSKLEKEDYYIVKETEKYIFLAIGNWQTNGYFARHYLRQKGDGNEFGSGPTWCIADGKEGGDMWRIYNLEEGSYPNTYMLLSKSDSLTRYQFTFKPQELDEFINGEIVDEVEEYDDESEEYYYEEVTRSFEETINEVRDIFQDKAENDNSVFKDIESKLKISLDDIGNWILEKKDELYDFRNGKQEKVREKLNKIYNEIENKKHNYVEYHISEEIKEILNISDEDYGNKNGFENALYNTALIYFENKKLRNDLLKLIFDLYYYTSIDDDGAIMDSIMKSNITFKDFINITKLLEENDKSFRMSEVYGHLFYKFLFFKHQNDPISVNVIVDNKLQLIVHGNFLKEEIKKCRDYNIQRCLSGDIFKIYTISGDYIEELLKHYPQNCFTKETLTEDECYVLNCIRRHWEEKNKEPNFLLRLLFVYAFQNYDDEEGEPFDERGYTMEDFVFNHPNFEKMLLDFIGGCSEKYLKKFVTNIELKDYLCHVLDKQSNRSREAIFGLWNVVKKYKNLGLITDSEYNQYEEKYNGLLEK